MDAKQKTIAMLEADLEAAKPFLRYMLEEYNACDEVMERLEEARQPFHIKRLIREFDISIAERIGVKVLEDLDEAMVVKFIESRDLSPTACERIYPHLDVEDHWIEEDYLETKFRSSLMNRMKFDRFMELIDNVTLDDLDALTAKYRPNSLEALNQMKMVV